LIRSIAVVFLHGAMLPVSEKYDSINQHTQEISELMKLHIQGVWQNAYKVIRQHCPHSWTADLHIHANVMYKRTQGRRQEL